MSDRRRCRRMPPTSRRRAARVARALMKLSAPSKGGEVAEPITQLPSSATILSDSRLQYLTAPYFADSLMQLSARAVQCFGAMVGAISCLNQSILRNRPIEVVSEGVLAGRNPK